MPGAPDDDARNQAIDDAVTQSLRRMVEKRPLRSGRVAARASTQTEPTPDSGRPSAGPPPAGPPSAGRPFGAPTNASTAKRFDLGLPAPDTARSPEPPLDVDARWREPPEIEIMSARRAPRGLPPTPVSAAPLDRLGGGDDDRDGDHDGDGDKETAMPERTQRFAPRSRVTSDAPTTGASPHGEPATNDVIELIDMVGADGRVRRIASPPPAENPLLARAAAAAAAAVEGGGAPNATANDALAALLRPMLQQWLDDNLPSVLERLAREEIGSAAPPADARKPKR